MAAAHSHFSLLVIDDEPDLRTLYELTLIKEGYDVETAACVEEALVQLKDRTYSAVITDMRLPDGTGLDLLHYLEANARREKAIVITAYGSAENAVEALKAGAYDYLTKPVDLKQFRAVIASALGRVSTVVPSSAVLPNAVHFLPEAPSPLLDTAGGRIFGLNSSTAAVPLLFPPSTSVALSRMAGHSQAMGQVRTLVEKVARSMAPVLVHGESGTGKELVARAIHEVSVRATQPFVAVNCSAIPEHLLEAEFFGYRKGAFTGAAEDRQGFFQAANGGTLFLDEIGDLPLAMQSKLLRAIQERSVRPVGAVAEQPVNVRLLSATHKDLACEVQAKLFRQDLYYRLNVIQILVPPLRERLEDLPLICTRVLSRIAHDTGMSEPVQLTQAALHALSRYHFPGNVRELENLLHRAVALSGGRSLDVADICVPSGEMDVSLTSTSLSASAASRATSLFVKTTGLLEHAAAPKASAAEVGSVAPRVSLPVNLAEHLDDIERDVLERALQHHRYNRTAAGASLGLSLRQMRYRMARLGVHAPHEDPDV
jgi:two-component system, NtrC family, response regulator PilR